MSQDLNPNPRTCSSLVIFMHWACEGQGSIFLVLRSESLSGKCAQFQTVEQATIEITRLDHSIIACSRHIFVCALRAHPVRDELHFQRNAN